MALADAGAAPARLAQAIHDQLDLAQGPVPMFDIARALDIHDIRIVSTKGFEAALVTTPERESGAVVLNADSAPRRRNFSLGHELGHFLNPWHTGAGDGGFQCSRSDMTASDAATQSRHLRQEAEANRFAIELLAPQRLMKPFLAGEADLSAITAAGEHLDISRAAAARRYVELHGAPLAVVFSHRGRVAFIDRSADFPFVELWTGNPLPEVEIPDDQGAVSDWTPLDADAWLRAGTEVELFAQTLRQADGHAMTLLSVEGGEEG